jgi:Flp pilus assembly protein TadD
MERGRLDSARATLEHVLRIDSNYVDANRRLGGLLVRMGDAPHAIRYLERVNEQFPTDETLVTLATAYIAVKRMDDARSALERAVTLNPNRTDAAAYVGELLAEQGHPDQAVPYLEAATRGGMAPPQVYASLSLVCAQSGRVDEAKDAAAAAASSAGADSGVFLTVGRAMLVVQDVRTAAQYFDEAVHLAPANPEALTQLGIVKAVEGDRTGAKGLLGRALEVSPGYAPARRALTELGESPDGGARVR